MDDGIITIDSSEDETSPEKIKKNNDIIILDEENTPTRHKRKLYSAAEENNVQLKQEIYPEAPCHKRIKLITCESEYIKKNEIKEEPNLDVTASVQNHDTNKNPSSSSEALTNSEIETITCTSFEYNKEYKDVVMSKIPNLNLQSEDTEDKKKNEIKELESNLDVNPCTQNHETNKNPSSSSQTIAKSEFEIFIAACTSCEYNKEYKDVVMNKIPNLRRKFNDADENFIESKIFKKFIIEKTEKLLQKPINAVCIFNDVLRELEAKRKRSINLTEREKAHLEKLYLALRKVDKKIKKLENQEVNFEDDNNSSYIMMQRYRQRLCTIQKKICCYTKENYYSGRYLYRNLDFKDSKYSEINRAINKLYYKKKQFPSFYDIHNCIKKCVQNNNIQLTEDEIGRESRRVFEAVGNILQRRRKSELFDSLLYFVDGSDGDPAEKDPEFNAILQNRQHEHKKRIDEVIQKFTERQERGYEEPVLSSDSDDSNYKSENSDL